LFNGFLLAFFIAMMIDSNNIRILNNDAGARYWPMTILGIAVFIFSVKVRRIWKNLPKEERRFRFTDTFRLKEPGTQKLLLAFILLVAYATLLPYGGFILTTILFSAALCCILGSRSALKSLLGGVAVAMPIYVIFGLLLGIRLPRGIGVLHHISLWFEMLMR